MRSVLIAILLSCFIFKISCAVCEIGEVLVKPGRGMPDECDPCFRGYYCPGDDKNYRCAPGSVAPKQGMSSCLRCESSISSPTNTYCMPSDTPSDIKLLQITNIIGLLSWPRSKPHYTMEVTLEPRIKTKIITIFRYYNTDNLVLFGSFTSGNPSSDNNEFKGSGENITIVVNRPKGSEGLLYVPVYLTVRPINKETEMTWGVTDVSNQERIEVSEPLTKINLTTTSFLSYIFFTVPNVPSQSRLNFTILTVGENANIRQSLFYSYDRNLKYPSGSNYNLKIVQDEGRNYGLTGLIVNVAEGGNVYFSGLPYCSYSKSPLMLYVYVDIKK